MALRRIVQIDQPEDSVILRAKSTRITRFDASLQPLVDDMIDTMRATDGVGLAAPQVGVLRRIGVMEQPAQYGGDPDENVRAIAPAELIVMINPEIIKASTDTIARNEGCLSMPGRYGLVPRASWVTVKYQDIDGKAQRLRHAAAETTMVGRIAQHEIDHLDGIMYTDRMTDLTSLVDIRQDVPPLRRRPLLRRRTQTDLRDRSQE